MNMTYVVIEKKPGRCPLAPFGITELPGNASEAKITISKSGAGCQMSKFIYHFRPQNPWKNKAFGHLNMMFIYHKKNLKM